MKQEYRRKTDVTEVWADRRKPKKLSPQAAEWSEEQDAFLKAACETSKSFGEIAKEMNALYPDNAKTRNAVIGRAGRKGYSEHKPGGYVKSTAYKKGGVRVTYVRKATKIKYAGQVTRRVRRIELAPVVFKTALRDDAEPFLRQSGPHTMKRRTAEQIKEARKGHLPCIVEAEPLTSVAIAETECDACKWPTSEDIACMEVCGAPAEYGAYCERHALVAYREMPTRRRNKHYARRGMIDVEQRLAREQDARIGAMEQETESPGIAGPEPMKLLEFKS